MLLDLSDLLQVGLHVFIKAFNELNQIQTRHSDKITQLYTLLDI